MTFASECPINGNHEWRFLRTVSYYGPKNQWYCVWCRKVEIDE